MSGTLNKGSLVKSSGGSGGGGSASFPMIVTDSGSSLPSASGYQEGDTFLNTSDNKTYTMIVEGYDLNSNVTSNVTVDLITGIASGFGTNKNIYRTGSDFLWTGDKEIKIHFKETEFPSGKCAIFRSSTFSGTSGREATVYLSNDHKIHFALTYYNQGPTYAYKDTEIAEISTNVEYYLKITKTGTSGKAELFTDSYAGTLVASVDFATEDYIISGQTTSTLSFSNSSTGSFYPAVNDYIVVYLADSTGNFLTISSGRWNDGTDLTDKTEYADKTNGALYLYENTELVKIGGSLTKKVYTISADNTSTLDVSSDFTKVVDVLKNGVELALTDDYTISSGVITFVTALSTTDKITVKGE